MALLKKNKVNEYEQASRNLNNYSKSKTSFERIIFEKLIDDDKRVTQLVDNLKQGNPLVINLSDLELMEANKMLAFLSGACYASEGNIIKINEFTYLFARKVDFLDGSLKEFLEDL